MQRRFYLIFTSPELAQPHLPVLNAAVGLLTRAENITERVMLARKAMSMRIEAVHSRAICDEIGDRLREILRREATSELPPRLQQLMERLAEADRETAPSLVPSLEDMIQQQPIGPRQQSPARAGFDEQFA
jgi:hypothetical protein